MKHQQAVVDYWAMIKTSEFCLLLAFSGYVLIKMLRTIFGLPGQLKTNQKRLEELIKQYAQDISEEDRVEMEKMFNCDEPLTEEMLKKFLDKPETEPEKTTETEPKKDL